MNNPQDILEPLWDLYKQHFPSTSGMDLARFKGIFVREETDAESNALSSSPQTGIDKSPSFQTESKGREDDADDLEKIEKNRDGSGKNSTPENHSSSNAGVDYNQVSSNPTEEANGSPFIPIVSISEEGAAMSSQVKDCTGSEENDNPSNVSALKKFGVSHYNMTWEQYDQSIYGSSDREQQDLFDFILTDPPYALQGSNLSNTGRFYNDFIDEEAIARFCRFCRRSLKPGGYFLIFTSFALLSKWWDALKAAGLAVWNYPYLLVKDSSQQVRNKSFLVPQNCAEPACMGYLPPHDEKFGADLKTPYSLIPCSHTRKFAVLDKVGRQRKLCVGRSPVRVEEKNSAALAEILCTFCPPGGLVFDGFAGTMTTAIACIATGRKCVVVEKDPKCYKLALERLDRIASRAQSEQRSSVRSEITTRSRGISTVLSIIETAVRGQKRGIQNLSEDCGSSQESEGEDDFHGPILPDQSTGKSAAFTGSDEAPIGPLEKPTVSLSQ